MKIQKKQERRKKMKEKQEDAKKKKEERKLMVNTKITLGSFQNKLTQQKRQFFSK